MTLKYLIVDAANEFKFGMNVLPPLHAYTETEKNMEKCLQYILSFLLLTNSHNEREHRKCPGDICHLVTFAAKYQAVNL